MRIKIFLLIIFLIDVAYYVAGSSQPNNSTSTKLTKINADKVSYPKKVTTLKKKPVKAITANTLKTKSTKISLTDVFKNLPADDFAFIKDLDKQINQHGGKLKIKIENDNSTDAKNVKRTIDGELGYGYNAQNGYNYAAPKYEFYPYSQHPIPPAASKQQQYAYYLVPQHHHEQQQQQHKEGKEHLRTEVSIEPSYSYELKTHDYYEEQPQIDLPKVPHHQQHQHEDDPTSQEQPPQPQHGTGEQREEPVIVLRIPGPTKYAAHLQALLQQYLEIRAAQYLQILEEHELRQQQQQQHEQQQQHHTAKQVQAPDAYYEQHPQSQHQPEQPQQEHQQQTEQKPEEHVKQQHNVEEKYEYQAPAPEYGPPQQAPPISETPPAQYPAVEQQYQQQVYHVQQQQQQQHQQQEEPPVQQYAYYDESGQVYNKEPAYQYVYATAKDQETVFIPPSRNPDVYLLHMSAVPAHHHYQQELPMSRPIYVPDNEYISENNPRPTHTKVIFKAQHPHASVHSEPHDYERHPPIYRPNYVTYYTHQQHHPHHHHQQQQQQQQPQQLEQQREQQNINSESQNKEVIITQRPHSYGQKLRTVVRGRRRGNNSPTPAPTSRATMDTEHHYRKITNYVQEKFGAQTGTSVELTPKSKVKH